MPENVQNILNKGKDWWTKFSTKQKALAVSITAAVLIALVILAVVMNQPKMELLAECENTKQASEVKNLLDGEEIKCKISSDGLTFWVNQKDMTTATLLLGSNEIPTADYDLDKVFDGSFSTTESDKNKKYQRYLEGKFEDQLETISGVEEASVSLSIPVEDGTIISMNQETYASVILTLNSELDDEQAVGIAKFIATEVGNDSTDNILIIDGSGNVLFSGGDTNSAMGNANSQLSVKNKAENMVKSEVKSVVLGTDVYDNVEVGLNLNMNFDSEEYMNHHYYLDEGQEQGYLDSESVFESEATGGEAAVPGTTANDDPTYVMPDGETTSSSVSERKSNYLPSEEITKRNSEGSTVDYATSSISVVATSYVVYDEKALKADGTLDNISFDEFVAQNSDRVKTTVDQEFYDAVANATGIPVENITFIAYDVPFFKYASAGGRDLADYLQIVLAVLIFALLGFVVFKSTRKQPEEVIEPELSVESLLETTKEATEENGLEDIGYSEKSETRILIEKFVEENPEAAATLLRNWLNEEWE
ncbi:MAG: flagellar M-ring protein FliF [Roseburia sp.]|nr:flagellar M-ring protein FliF [Roseburia sp.]